MEPIKTTRVVAKAVADSRSEPIRVELGFWNWDRSAWITDAAGYGQSEEEATQAAYDDYEAEMRRPHSPEDALGLGLLHDGSEPRSQRRGR